MIRRWIVFLAAVLGCLVLCMAYQGWLAWLLLNAVLVLPPLSLVLSLPAMLTLSLTPTGMGAVPMGTPAALRARIRCPLPAPVYTCRLRVTRTTTGESWILSAGDPLPTDHCGQLLIRPDRCRVYDYLCLFRMKLRRVGEAELLVRPLPAKTAPPRDLERFLARGWQPKRGGGFSENHELRLYRPGDGLNQIHWKLTAKTGKLMIREPMEPRRGLAVVSLDLSGTPDELDRKLSRLLGLGGYLLERELPFELRALTGDGLRIRYIAKPDDLTEALDELLRSEAAGEGSILDRPIMASWYCHIGGEPDED